MIDKFHEPLFKPISFEADIDKATGSFRVDGIVDSKAEPIRNPVTKQPHHAKVSLRKGFEYTDAEFASKGAGMSAKRRRSPLEWAGRHGHLAMIHITGQGLMR